MMKMAASVRLSDSSESLNMNFIETLICVHI